MANLNGNVRAMVGKRLRLDTAPATLGKPKPMKLRPAQTPNYLGSYNKKRNRRNHAFRVPTIGGDFGA